MTLTDFQKRLLNALQNGLPIMDRPYAQIALSLGATEQEVLQQTAELKKMGIIRRIRAMINYRALGFASTLVTAHVPDPRLESVTQAVNALEGVSHNYLRDHHYNMWFTLQTPSESQLDNTLTDLSSRFQISFHSLPVIRFFKLDVRFDAEDNQRVLLNSDDSVQSMHKVELNNDEKMILPMLQKDLEVIPEPFAYITSNRFDSKRVSAVINSLRKKGVIRRVAGVVNHRKLGLVANAMLVTEIPREKVTDIGQSLSALGLVSHCYERKAFEGWPFNIFAMMHGRDINQITHTTEEFAKTNGLENFQLLRTVRELKKQPINYKLG